jgi:hypothetical protein
MQKQTLHIEEAPFPLLSLYSSNFESPILLTDAASECMHSLASHALSSSDGSSISHDIALLSFPPAPPLMFFPFWALMDQEREIEREREREREREVRFSLSLSPVCPSFLPFRLYISCQSDHHLLLQSFFLQNLL